MTERPKSATPVALQERERDGPRIGGPDYAPLNEASVARFLAGIPGLRDILGGAPESWRVREVGDGNLNLVFIVKGAAGGLVVKQALPYVRLVGESWPLPLERAYFEREALAAQGAIVPSLVPRVHHFDAGQAALVMELLEPHIILRKGLTRGLRYPRIAEDIATFTARVLFYTSDLGAPAAQKRRRQALFSHNVALCRITEDLVFTDPYRVAPLNRWTSPQLDDVAKSYREDAALKVAVQELKWAFLAHGEALIHGDLHTGSIMVTQTDTRVIDPEFAVYGPMGFDVGAFMANLLLAYFAQDGHAGQGDDRAAHAAWILDALESYWTQFSEKFLACWTQDAMGDALAPALFANAAGEAALDAFRQETMGRLFADSLGFAGAKMARRILGLAHVEDLESIADPENRASCERRALAMARTLMLDRHRIDAIASVRALAEDVRAESM